MSDKRLRVVGYLVKPQVMLDDGDNLTPLDVNAVMVPASDWPNVGSLLGEAMERLVEQVEGSSTA